MILKRRPKSGFVSFPKEFPKRTVDGTARFRTRCDMLVGPCACGGVHQENDEWVQYLLHDYNAVIEPFILILHEDGTVVFPRYWQRPSGHIGCTVLQGQCACGQCHRATSKWVQLLLREHNAIIENMSSLPQFESMEVEFTLPITRRNTLRREEI